MSSEKRIKKFSTIDDILLSPGTTLEYLENLRTQIYYMQKKLKKHRHRDALRGAVEDSVNAGFKYLDTVLTSEQSEKADKIMYETALASAKKRGLVKE